MNVGIFLRLNQMNILANVIEEIHGSALVPHLEDELGSGINSFRVTEFRGNFALEEFDSLACPLRETNK